MPRSNFPNGFAQGVTIRGVPITQAYPGEVFWVNNSTVLAKGAIAGSDGNAGTYNAPFSTLAYALTKCTANRGDIIMIMPGHAESITSATALSLNVAGVGIFGLGTGTKRPTFTYTTADTATIRVDAANVSIKGCRFVANFLGVVSAFTLGAVAAAPAFCLEENEFTDTSAVLNFKAIVTTTVSVDANDLAIRKNLIRADATTKSTAPIVILNTMTGLRVLDNEVYNSVAQNNVSQLVSHAALVMTDMIVARNKVYCVNTDTATGAVLVSTTATTGSGLIHDNTVRALDVAAAILVTATAVQYGMFNNLYTGETSLASGFVLPAIGTDA